MNTTSTRTSSQQPLAHVAIASPHAADELSSTQQLTQALDAHSQRPVTACENEQRLSWLAFRGAAKHRIRQRVSEMLRPSGTEDQLDVEFPATSRRWQVSVPAAVALVSVALVCCGVFVFSQVLTSSPVVPNAGYLQSAMPTHEPPQVAMSTISSDAHHMKHTTTSESTTSQRASGIPSQGDAGIDANRELHASLPVTQEHIPASAEQGRAIAVAVVGVVKNPGIYRFLTPDARVLDAIERAGIVEDSQLQGLNLAAKLQDGMQIVIPHRSDAQLAHTVGALEGPSTPIVQEDRQSQDSAQLNINTASETELTTLPGVGAKTAAAIVAYRQQHGPFQNVTELQQVKGIGAAKYEALAPHIRI
ncbi:ComEA family DNA-binding protein [Corynebacterium sp. HS2168-gen11]|uniref:ComEA family DNA-binding protein n=1 Tax=Corynebacterium sp. HS2168-gen11 TaxID=2974027 RepID=UPI00216B40BF|nr:ComEA family DNA-binding protein [Corynebacterium sp. HS2168-gen11]MCS4535346.1 ComEA family DNA-binding protein [Corynebacterium sp. HS2168-gen11]